MNQPPPTSREVIDLVEAKLNLGAVPYRYGSVHCGHPECFFVMLWPSFSYWDHAWDDNPPTDGPDPSWLRTQGWWPAACDDGYVWKCDQHAHEEADERWDLLEENK